MLSNMKSSINKVIANDNQTADFVELFFDLVFVFAITKVTQLIVHHIDIYHVLQAFVIFWLIWWGWTQFTWALNSANTKHPKVRLGTLIATAIAFIMASSTDMAFGMEVFWFSIPYIAVRVLGLLLFLTVSPKEEGQRGAVIIFASFSVMGLAAVLLGSFVNPTFRLWWWMGAIVLDYIAGLKGARSESWNLRTKHFAERHGLIVIIALGESLIVAANAVSGEQRTLPLIIAGGLTVIITCLLWWSYFAWIGEYIELHFAKLKGSKLAQMGRDAYSMMHFPLVFGIIGIAVGFERILGHPQDPLTIPVAACLGGGITLYIAFTAASVWRTSGTILYTRLIILVSMIGVMILSIGSHPSLILLVITIGLALIVIIEGNFIRKSIENDMDEQ